MSTSKHLVAARREAAHKLVSFSLLFTLFGASDHVMLWPLQMAAIWQQDLILPAALDCS